MVSVCRRLTYSRCTMRELSFFVLFSLSLICPLAAAENTTEDAENPYCLHFTWLGPLYDSTSTVNISCDDYTGTPCIEPLVVTTDGSEPNITYMWENYNRSIIGCPLRAGYTCIKYTYVYDNALMNASYFCGKMIENTEEALTSGCYTEKTGGYTVGACACRSNAGEFPCNANGSSLLSQSILIFIAISYFGNVLFR